MVTDLIGSGGRMRALLWLVVLVAVPVAHAQDEHHVAAERLALLPEAERTAWERYLERSGARAEQDLAAIRAELDALGRADWTPAPHSRAALFRDEMDAAWFASGEARRLAENVLSYQTPSGGWSKNVDLRKRPRQPGESYYSGGSWSYIGTFDNDATTEEMRFLGKAYEARGDDRYRDAFLRGLEYVLEAQFPNGCWPQVYPLQGGYHDAATFNDEAIPNILHLLRRVSRGEFDFVPAELRQMAGEAMWLGVDCVLDAQVVVEGRLTVWGQQHDPITLEPAQGRAYEHPSLTAGESVDVVEFLMGIESPPPRVVESVHAAAEWFRDVALYGLEYEHPHLIRREGAGPIWARFYELGTNRPIFSNRDGVILYSWHELDDERRRGYGWYRYSPATLLRAHERWAVRHPRSR
jgi:PelA/Pel-15E family pectate lyase